MEGARPVRAPRGTTLTARSWQTEAPLRMLQNNLDPEVAERPDDLVVYGGTGRAARDWRSFDAMVRTLTTLRGRRDDARAVRQAGRRAAHPRVGAAGAHRQLQPRRRLGHLARVPPPRAARPDHVRPDDRRLVDLHRHPGHPAGHLRDVRRRRRQAVRRHAGRHAHPHRRLRRHGRRAAARGHAERRRLPRRRRRPDPAAPPRRAPLPRRAGRRPRRRHRHVRGAPCASGAPVGRRGRQLRRGAARAAAPRRRRRHRHRPDLGPRPAVLPARRASRSTTGADYAAAKPEEFTDRARASMARHVEAMVGFLDAGAEVFDYGNSIRDEARHGGFERAFAFPGFVPAYIRPLFCEGKGPFRWAALSGDPADIAATDEAVLDLFPDNDHLHRWIRAAQERVAFQGLPARICWLGYGERDKAGLRFNELVADGRVSAPIVIGRDHLDSGSVASPYRETEAMADGSDAIADWPLLNALNAASSGATWVSIHHGGGVGIGRSIHAGQVSVADGTAARGGEARAGADQRPGDGRDPARRRRLRRGPHHRGGAGRPHPDGGRVSRSRASRAANATAERGRGARRRASSRPRGPRARRSRGYRRFAWTREDAELREWFTRRGQGPRARRRRRPGRQPRGLVGRSRRGRARRRHRLAPGLGARRRRVRRPARRRLRVRRARRAARGRVPPRAPARRGLLRRRGGRAVRRGLRGLAAAHRRARPPTGPPGSPTPTA